MHGRTALCCTSSSGCEQMITELTHIDGDILDLELVPNVVEVRVGLPVGALDHRAVFIDVMLKQPMLHVGCRPQRIRTL